MGDGLFKRLRTSGSKYDDATVQRLVIGIYQDEE